MTLGFSSSTHYTVIVVPYVLNVSYAYFSVFYNVNEFYVFVMNFNILIKNMNVSFCVFTPGLM